MNFKSKFGFGCMRFTSTAGKIDIDKAQEEILAAYWASSSILISIISLLG